MNIKQIKTAVVNWVFCQSFRERTFFKIQEYPSVDDSEGKKRVHGVWTVWFIVEWFTVADLLYPRSNGYHYRPKSTPTQHQQEQWNWDSWSMDAYYQPTQYYCRICKGFPAF